jgi:hypothetical protein
MAGDAFGVTWSWEDVVMGYLLNDSERYFFAKNTGKKPFKLDYDRSRTCDDAATLQRRKQLCVDAGLIRQATPDEVACELHTLEQFKSLLKVSGLKVGGNKQELLERLKAADPCFEASLPVADYWMLTSTGDVLRGEIWQAVRAGEAVITLEIMHLLSLRRYDEAFDTYWRFVATDFTGQQCVDRGTFEMFVEKMDKLPDGEREQAIFTVMGGRPHYTHAAMTAQKAAYYQRGLMQARETPGAIGIRIEPPPDGRCSKAAKYAGCYRLEEAPDYPFSPCSQDDDGLGCTCLWTTVFHDKDNICDWKSPVRQHPNAGPPIVMAHEPLNGAAIQSSIRDARASGMLAETRQETALPPAPALPKGLVKRAGCQQSVVAEDEPGESLRCSPNALSEKPKTLVIPPPGK